MYATPRSVAVRWKVGVLYTGHTPGSAPPHVYCEDTHPIEWRCQL